MARIACLGLGAMGSRMASRLIGASHAVTVWNRSPGPAAALAAQGAHSAATPREAAAGAEAAIAMVTDDAAARAVWLDPADGALAGLARGAVAIECSTVTPAFVAALDEAAHAAGVALIDAPVAGSRPQAEAGQLIVMAGGPAEAVEQARPILAAFGPTLLHAGATGRGAALKLAVNALFAAQLAGVAELLGLLSRQGIAPGAAADMLAAFPVVGPAIAGAARMMAADAVAPLFPIDLIVKDLGYALDLARKTGADLPGTAGVRAVFQRAQAAGLGERNVTAVARLFA